ncbi:uncharacterized protein LOC121100518 [Ursus maritimus]|uniref:Uncharacterized protein LOC121100518 n=1 Tax=Ursus maritimus TaxID=29073 RepID=A0A8M1F341_URSMA|nr:uncharacterized protein LOC121100518 [Ursus maritimus]
MHACATTLDSPGQAFSGGKQTGPLGLASSRRDVGSTQERTASTVPRFPGNLQHSAPTAPPKSKSMDTHTVLGWETDDGLARDWEARQGPSGRVGGPGIPRSPAFPPQEHVRQGGSAGARYPGASTESTRSYPSRVRDPESEGDGRGSGRRSEPNQPDCAEVTGGRCPTVFQDRTIGRSTSSPTPGIVSSLNLSLPRGSDRASPASMTDDPDIERVLLHSFLVSSAAVWAMTEMLPAGLPRRLSAGNAADNCVLNLTGF